MKKITFPRFFLLLFLIVFAIEIAPAQSVAISDTEVLMGQNKYLEVISILSRKRALMPKQSIQLAISHMNIGEAKLALGLLLKLKDNRNLPFGYYYILANAYERNGKSAFAVAYLHRFLHRNENELMPYEIACVKKKISKSLGKSENRNIKKHDEFDLKTWYKEYNERVENKESSISSDGRVFVFSVNQSTDTQSNEDLFYSVKDKYGIWSLPIPFEREVNSTASETRPIFQEVSTKILQFSRVDSKANGMPTVYQTRYNPKSCSWENPVPVQTVVRKAN